MTSVRPTERTRLRRKPGRGAYQRETINAILDEALVCHLGLVQDDQAVVIPTLHARRGDALLLHGSAASRALRFAAQAPVSVTVTLLDGLVLARSAFHHSANYRSVVIFGQCELIEGDDEKLLAFEAFVERLMPGRWEDVRQPSAKELKATSILSLPLDEASAKIRTGPPVDDEDDYALDVWAGVIPMELKRLPAIRDVARKPGPS